MIFSNLLPLLMLQDLVEDLKSETSGDFRDLLVALYEDPVEFEARCLHQAMVGLGTDEEVCFIRFLKIYRYNTIYIPELKNSFYIVIS